MSLAIYYWIVDVLNFLSVHVYFQKRSIFDYLTDVNLLTKP